MSAKDDWFDQLDKMTAKERLYNYDLAEAEILKVCKDGVEDDGHFGPFEPNERLIPEAIKALRLARDSGFDIPGAAYRVYDEVFIQWFGRDWQSTWSSGAGWFCSVGNDGEKSKHWFQADIPLEFARK